MSSALCTVTSVGSAVGALTTMFFILVLGLFFAAEPRVYERGLQWMIPEASRAEFSLTIDRMGFTLRRLMAGKLLGMAVEGVLTWAALALGGVPLAALLGIITGILAFIPNIGAIVSGLLMVAVGFSAGPSEGLFAIFVYFAVQNIDGYLVLPYIARRTVDLAPAVVLAAQLILGALFGFLGLLLADSILAAIKVTLQEISKQRSMEAGEPPQVVGAAGAPEAPPA